MAVRPGLSRISWAALGLVTLVGLVLRVIGIDHLPGVNGDEAFYGVHALAWLHGASFFDLRTGTHLPMNPPYFGLVVALHRLFEPSVLTLRLAPLLHSYAAVALAYVLFRGRGRAFAALFACVLALLPMHLGYARFAWDSSAVPTVMLLALAAATRRRPLWTLLAFGLCLWVHPMTMFAAPVLLAPLLEAWWPRTAAGVPRLPSWRVVFAALALFEVLVVALVVLVHFNALPPPVLIVLRGPILLDAPVRLVSPLEAIEFLRLYIDLLSGATLYRYITGSLPETASVLHQLGGLVIIGGVIGLGVRRLWATRSWQDLAVVIGLALSLLAAYLAGGSMIVDVATSRYGMFLTVPSCYVLAVTLEALAPQARHAAWSRLGVAAVGAVLLTSFANHYLAALHHADSRRDDCLRTGDIEPKQRALATLRSMRDPRRAAIVLTEDWWTYWPVRYLGDGDPMLHITLRGQRPDPRFPRDLTPPPFDPARMELFAVAWAGSRYDVRMQANALQSVAIPGYEPQPILRVHRLRPTAPMQ